MSTWAGLLVHELKRRIAEYLTSQEHLSLIRTSDNSAPSYLQLVPPRLGSQSERLDVVQFFWEIPVEHLQGSLLFGLQANVHPTLFAFSVFGYCGQGDASREDETKRVTKCTVRLALPIADLGTLQAARYRPPSDDSSLEPLRLEDILQQDIAGAFVGACLFEYVSVLSSNCSSHICIC